ncbi:MAG: PAS domain S-box protein [Promethearchaeota archaeon]
MENELRESEEKYRLILENANDLICILNHKFKFEYINEQTFLKVLGYSNDDLIGKAPVEFIHPDDFERAANSLRDDFNYGERLEELRVKNKKGRYIWIEAKGRLFTNKKGENKVILILRDITKRKMTEEKLKESEKKYRFIFENTPFSVILFNSEGIVVDCNPTTQKLFGYTKKELIGRHFENVSIIHPKYSAIFFKFFNEFLKGEKLNRIDLQLYKKDGSLIWVSNLLSLVRLNNRVFVQGIFRDITEKREAEEALKESEEKYRLISENAYDLIVILSQKLVLEYVNKSFLKILNFSNEEVIGKTPKHFVHPEDYIKSINALKEGFIKGEGMEIVRIKRKDGYYIWFEVKGRTFIDKIGEKKALLILRDITERKKVEQELKESEQKYRGIIEKNYEGYFEADLKGNYTFVNKSVIDFYGYSKEKFIGENFDKFLNPDDVNRVFKEFNLLYKNELPQIILEHESITKEGHKKLVETVAYLKRNSKGEKIGFYGLSRDISIRKELKESERKYRYLFEHSPFTIILFTFDGKIIDANSKVFELIGYKREEVIGKNFQELTYIIPKKYFPTVLELFRKRLTQKSVGPTELQLCRENGKLIWISVQGIVLEIGDDKFLQIIIQDIEEKREAENKLKKSEKKFRTIIENSNYPYYEVDLSGNLTFFNNALCDLFQYSPKELKGMNYKNYISQEYTKQIFKIFNDVYKTGFGKKNVQYEIILKNGKKLYGETTIQLKYDSKGEKIGFSGFVRDITEQKIAEQKLKESEKKFRSILENMNDGYFEVDLKGNYTFVNDYVSNYLGYPKKELLRTNYKNVIRKESLNDVFNAFSQLYKFNLPKIVFETTALRNDGEKRFIEGSAYLKYNSKGDKVGFAGFTRDITEKKKAEMLIIEENKKLIELDQMRRDLITRVSHELKTPLTSIYGASQFLIDNYKKSVSVEALEFIEMINRAGGRLKELINNLLDASRIESGKLILNCKRENLVDIIRNCKDDMIHLANKKKLILNIDFPKKIFVKLDKIRIEQVFINIISNAIKNTPSRGHIYIKLYRNNSWACISIKDTGIGLTKKEKEKLFKKFGKIERYEMCADIDGEGSGLGLYISKEIVELHGGKIYVESKGRNKGSEFIVKLPVENKIL